MASWRSSRSRASSATRRSSRSARAPTRCSAWSSRSTSASSAERRRSEAQSTCDSGACRRCRGASLPPGGRPAAPARSRRSRRVGPDRPLRRRAGGDALRPLRTARRARRREAALGTHGPARPDRRPRPGAHGDRATRGSARLLSPRADPGAARAQSTRPRRARGAAPPACRLLALGREPRGLACPLSLRPRARAPEPARLRARLLDVLRIPRLDATRGSGLAPEADRRRPRRAGCGDVRHGSDPHRRARLHVHAALPLLPRRARDLGPHRSAALGDRDDGRATPHARHLRRAAPAAWGEPRRRGAARRSNVSATAFSFEPLFLAFAVTAAVLYWRAARTDRPPAWRIAAFASGIFLTAAALNSPLETIASKYLLLIHLLQNGLIADLAPLLVLLGLTPRMRAEIGRRGLDRLRTRWILPIWLGAWYLTHIAVFYNWALRTGWGLNVEHAILIAAGLLFWWPIVSGRLSPPAGLAYLVIAFLGSSFLGLAYIFSSRPFYAFYEHAPRLWGLSPIRDQNLGGILMNGEQTLVFLLAIGWFVMRLLDEEHAREDATPAPREPLSDT